MRHTFPHAFPLHESHCPVSTSISTNRAGLRIGSFLSPSSSMDGDPFCFFPWGSGTFAFFPVDSVQKGKGHRKEPANGQRDRRVMRVPALHKGDHCLECKPHDHRKLSR